MRSRLFVLVFLAACGDPLTTDLGEGGFGDSGGTSGGGIDPGGAQDIGAAREIINSGGVPSGSLITVEGLLSEHDVPTIGAPCQSLICLRPATGVAPSLETGKLSRWVHIGMTTALDPATFQRPPVDLVVAIDKSSSMSIDMAQTTEAVSRLVGHMRADDRIAILAFDENVHIIHELGTVADVPALQTQIKAVHASGSWDINMAMNAAYGRLAEPSEGRIRHVVVLSCGYPGVSPTADDPTSMLIRDRGTAGVGITFVGVLLGWDPNLAALLGKTNGANYYYLGDLNRVQEVFDKDADLIIAPIAYDLSMQLSLPQGWKLARMYGIPGDKDGTPASGYTIATGFLSRKRGSIVARLEWGGTGSAPATMGTLQLSYRPEPALGWTAAENQSAAAESGTPEADGTYFAGPGVHKATMLVNMAVQMIEGCNKYPSNAADARAIIATLRDYLVDEQAKLGAPDMDAEITLVNKLLTNMGGT
ncbi:MAG TPA: VWA domain-containing protein [Kofleriaceae bacterium]|nr:VWA domain-containing protein [Kofleriaceae bacterium]